MLFKQCHHIVLKRVSFPLFPPKNNKILKIELNIVSVYSTKTWSQNVCRSCRYWAICLACWPISLLTLMARGIKRWFLRLFQQDLVPECLPVLQVLSHLPGMLTHLPVDSHSEGDKGIISELTPAEPGPRMSPCPAGTEPSAWHADPSPCWLSWRGV